MIYSSNSNFQENQKFSSVAVAGINEDNFLLNVINHVLLHHVTSRLGLPSL